MNGACCPNQNVYTINGQRRVAQSRYAMMDRVVRDKTIREIKDSVIMENA